MNKEELIKQARKVMSNNFRRYPFKRRFENFTVKELKAFINIWGK